MSYTPPNPNGQATSANSAPSVLSIEQQAILEMLPTKNDTIQAEINHNSVLVGLLSEILAEQRITNKLLIKIYQ